MTRVEFCRQMSEVLWQFKEKIMTAPEMRKEISKILVAFTDGVEQTELFDK